MAPNFGKNLDRFPPLFAQLRNDKNTKSWSNVLKLLVSPQFFFSSLFRYRMLVHTVIYHRRQHSSINKSGTQKICINNMWKFFFQFAETVFSFCELIQWMLQYKINKKKIFHIWCCYAVFLIILGNIFWATITKINSSFSIWFVELVIMKQV